jgi:hypothetical protein
MSSNKIGRCVLMALLLVGLQAGVSHGQAVFTVGSQDFSVSVGNFQSALNPYGTWYTSPTYGYVWQPSVYSGWNPYTTVSEPWYAPTKHYGQWINVSGYGWSWVPAVTYHPRTIIVSRPVRLRAPLRVFRVRGVAPRRFAAPVRQVRFRNAERRRFASVRPVRRIERSRRVARVRTVRHEFFGRRHAHVRAVRHFVRARHVARVRSVAFRRAGGHRRH